MREIFSDCGMGTFFKTAAVYKNTVSRIEKLKIATQVIDRQECPLSW